MDTGICPITVLSWYASLRDDFSDSGRAIGLAVDFNGRVCDDEDIWNSPEIGLVDHPNGVIGRGKSFIEECFSSTDLCEPVIGVFSWHDPLCQLSRGHPESVGAKRPLAGKIPRNSSLDFVRHGVAPSYYADHAYPPPQTPSEDRNEISAQKKSLT